MRHSSCENIIFYFVKILLNSMCFIKLSTILLFLLVFSIYTECKILKQDSNEYVTVCQSEVVDQADGVPHIWGGTSSDDSVQYDTAENYMCLSNYTNELVIRECDPVTKKWTPSSSLINCSDTQNQINRFCPEDLTEMRVNGKYFCLKIVEIPHVYNNSHCYGSDSLFGDKSMNAVEIDAIIHYLHIKKRINRFWIPVQRAEYNRYYNPFVVKLPGSRWGEVYETVSELPISIQDYFVDKHCMSIKIQFDNKTMSYISEVTNCSDILPSVCLFLNDIVAYSGCPQGFGALSYRPKECFGVALDGGYFPNEQQPVSIAEYIAKRNTLRLIFRSMEWNENTYFQVGIFAARNNISYAIEMNMNEKLQLVHFNEKQHALSSEVLTDFNRKSVEMVLDMNSEIGGLTLTVYNRNYIWRFSDEVNFGIKCFTNAGSTQWKSVKIEQIWQNFLETKSIFKLKLDDNDGYYWCEAHTIFDFSLIKTKKIVISRKKSGHTFALLYDIKCENMDCHDIFKKSTWKRLNRRANNFFSVIRRSKKKYKDLEVNYVRLMDIATVAKDGSQFQGLLHISAFLKSFPVDQGSEQSSEEFESIENELVSPSVVRMKVRDMLASIVNQFHSILNNFVRSTEFCFPEYFNMTNGTRNYWLLSKYGQQSTTAKLCLREYGTPLIRACKGDFLWGAYWENKTIFNTIQNCGALHTSNVTYKLQNLKDDELVTTSPDKATKKVRSLLEHNIKTIIPADLYYTSRILRRIMKNILKTKYQYDLQNSKDILVSNDAVTDIIRIYDFLSNVNIEVIKRSTSLNTTNILLEVFERLVDEMVLYEHKEHIKNIKESSIKLYDFNSTENAKNIDKDSSKFIEIIEKNHGSVKTEQYEDIGVIVKSADNLLIFIIDPTIANVTGIALFCGDFDYSNEINSTINEMSGKFQNERYQFLLANQSVDSLIYANNLQLGTYVPDTLLARLDEISRSANFSAKMSPINKIVIKIYATDLLFQENYDDDDDDCESGSGNITKYVIASKRVVSVSIPGHDKNLPEMLPLLFKIDDKADFNMTDLNCSYWNYNSWVDDGLAVLQYAESNNVILCGCTHLTPFAFLIGDSYNLSIDSVFVVKTHEKVLDVITILGCSLSLFGIVGIFSTAVTFQSWRQKASSKVLLQLSAAISLQMILFCFVNTEENSRNLMANDIFFSCIVIGALLHYSVLVQFSWMLIIGYLQFKRYVQVFGNTRPKRFLKKATLIGWGVPVIPVLIVLLFDQKAYIPDNEMNSQSICYPSGYSLYLAVVLPITIIILANFGIFATILYSIFRGPEENLRHTERGLALSQLRLSGLLFFLLGFTWIFGLLATLKAGLIFSYLFCLTATLQGFVLFIYFIILDPKTRRMWSGFFEKVCGLKVTYEMSSVKETVQSLQ